MEETKIKNPWLGLESYKEGEVLYGRDEDIRDLSQHVLNDTDTLLYGKSGIGKSSILNAGIIPAARRYGYQPVLVRLSHKEKESYLHQIKDAIGNEMVSTQEVVKCQDAEKENLYEYFHRQTFHNTDGERIKLLIIFDQFEEIFTLQEDESKKKRFFAELADFLNDVMPADLQHNTTATSEPQKKMTVIGAGNFGNLFNDLKLGTDNDLPEYVSDNEIHLVFTIREDFLSEFEYYSASIPSLKQNRYGLRPINEEQAAQIILRPMPGLIDESVAKLIIEKVTGRTDFELDGIPEIEVDSAVLSLYLNRLYDAKIGDTITSELVEQKGGEIIADFYIDAISEISESTIEYLEDMLLNGNGRRDNITVFDSIHDGGATEQELDILCNKKKILRQFNYAGDLRIEYVHDILCPVVKAHKDERLLVKQQEEERQRQEAEKQRILLEEKAKREQIEREAEEERNRLKAEAIRTRKRNRRRMYGVGAFILALLLGIAGYIWYYEWEHESYFAQFERVNGWPVGVGEELSPEEMSHLPLYYKLSHKGYLKYDTDVEVCSSNERLPRIPRIFCLEVCEMDSDSRAQEYLNLLTHIKSIHFEAGEKDRLNKEVIKGDNDSILYYVNYFYMQTEGQVWAQFVSSQGQAMTVRDNGLDRIKLTWHVSDDENDRNRGRVISMMYFDADGVSQTGANGIYGYQMDYSDDGMTSSLYSLDEYGRPFDATYNVVITNRSDNGIIDTRYAYATSVPDSVSKPVVGPNGFWREVKKGDEKLFYMPGQNDPSAKCLISTNKKGNTTELRMEGDFPAFIPAITKYSYAEGSGYRTSEERRNADGSPFNCIDGIYKRKWNYDNEGHLIMEEHYNMQEEKVYSHYIERKGNVVRDMVEDKNNSEFPIVIRVDSTKDNTTSTTYYGVDNRPINYKAKNEKAPFHRMVTDTVDNIKTTKYYCYNIETGKITRQIAKKDEYGRVESFYCKREMLDNDKNVVSRQIFDENERIVKSMMYFYQNGQNIGRSVMGIDGTPVRCDKWEEEGFLYYKFYYCKDFYKNYSALSAVDEWGRRSSTRDGSSYLFLDWYHFKGKYVDIYETYENLEHKRNMIGSTEIYKKYDQIRFTDDPEITRTEMVYIHILSPSSKMYNNKKGLKDGDRLIEFGNWKFGKTRELLNNEWRRIMTKGGTVHVEVLRPSVDSCSYSLKTFDFTCYQDESDLIEFHVLNMTKSEKEIIDKCLKYLND